MPHLIPLWGTVALSALKMFGRTYDYDNDIYKLFLSSMNATKQYTLWYKKLFVIQVSFNSPFLPKVFNCMSPKVSWQQEQRGKLTKGR